jgi:hypothetical protein
VNLLALGKDPWCFIDLQDQLNMYLHQWQADQQKQIIAKMDGKIPGKSNDGKLKNSVRNIHNNNGGRSGGHQGNSGHGGHGGRGKGHGDIGGRGNNNSDHLSTIKCYNCGKKVTIQLIAPRSRRKMMKIPTWYPKRILKPVSILIEGFFDQEVKSEQEKVNMDVGEESLDKNMF